MADFEEEKEVEEEEQLKTKKLADRFIIPPYSVLNTK